MNNIRGEGGNVVANTEQLAGPKGNEYSDVNNYKRQDKAEPKLGVCLNQ